MAIDELTDEQLFNQNKILLEQAQKQITDLTAKMNHELSKGRQREANAFQDEINKVQATVKDLAAKGADLQNKIYSSRGEYEKLLSGESRDAYLALKTVFANYGLDSLAGKIFDYVKNGYSSDTVSILLQDSDEYKTRFSANEARRKAGLNVLNPAEYIATENSYRQIMRQSGLPSGFYDTNDDFNVFLVGDVSPTELQDRVNLATQATALANPAYKQALQAMGLSQGEMAAYFLDPKKAMPIIQKTAATAAVGAEAMQRGFQFDQRYSEELATSGISREQAGQAYARIGDEFSSLSTLGEIYGGGWTQRQAEEDIFKGGTEATAQKKRLASQERGAFSGAVGGARGGFAQKGGQK